jgi:hypothetical protein
MTEDQFDDALKNKIRDHRSPVPDDMWERIIQKKDKDRKGFLFFFRWFTVLLLCVCLGGYLLMNHTKQKSEPANHALSSQDLKSSQTVPRLKEEVRSENNSKTNVQQPVPGKRRSYTSRTIRELKENEGDHGLFGDKKMVSKQPENGMQNSSSQRDSLMSGNGDSVTNKTESVNKSPAIVYPAVKSPADSSQKSIVKKTQKDSSTDKKWYLDIYASPDYPIDHTTYTSSNYISETMKLSYTIGLRINRAFGKHFSGKIGIQYSQINFTYPDSLNYLNGTVNHLKSFDLPVLAGYSFVAEKLKMTVTVGGIVNLSSFYTGDPFGDVFKTNTGFSLYLGFNLEKKVNQKISIYLEPYYRYRLTSMTISSVEFDKFIDVIGLSFGARYYFLKRTKK